ncbi:MAG TPA: type II secretion system F family protein [Gemmatimonadales bacterium]|nr:type II secretion system F family protein [Gemmatimonadales bacterium]
MVDIPSGVWLPALIAFLTVALGTISLIFLWEWFQENQRKRQMVDHLRSLANEPVGGPGIGSSVFRSAVLQSPWLRPIITRIPQLADAELILQQAGLSWSLQTLFLLSIGMAVALGSMVLVLTSSLPIGVLGTAVGALLPNLYVRRKRTKRLNAFEELLPESIDLVGRALRAGHPLSAGFKMAADDGPEPVAGEFRRIFEEQRFGLPLQDSLLALTDRVNLVDVRILVTAILIQREVGGNLAEILDNLAAVVRARFTIRRQIRVYTAQGRMTGYLLSALPIILFSILYMINGQYMSILFTDPIGKMLIGVAISMQFIGFLWIRKIIKIEI